MKIHEVYLDPADKYRVRVALDETESVFFKFQEFPTQEMVQAEVDKLIAAREAAILEAQAQENGAANPD